MYVILKIHKTNKEKILGGYIMFNIGLSSCGKAVNEQLFQQYKDADIKCMELSIKPDSIDYTETKAIAEKYGITLWSLHLPFTPFHVIDISNPDLAEYSVEYFKNIIKNALPLGVKIFVIHPSGEPIDNSQRQIRLDCAKQSLKKLGAFAEENGVTIAVEDLPRTCLGRNSTEILELISVHPNLRVCFDTNHLLGENLEDFIKNVGNKIVTTHVSDYDFIDERHWLPLEGKVDWQKVISSLKEVGYNGPWLYEIGFKYRDRVLTTHDFYENAHKLFELKK